MVQAEREWIHTLEEISDKRTEEYHEHKKMVKANAEAAALLAAKQAGTSAP